MPTSLFARDFQTVLENAKQDVGQPAGPFPSPQDWRDPWIYFLMVDRFNNSKGVPPKSRFDDPDFFGFYRSMQAYDASLKGKGARFVVSPSSDFFRYFDHASGKAPATP